MEYIRKHEWPPDRAKNAYDNAYFIEAIQVLHAWLECKCRELVMLVGAVYFDAELSDTWDIVDRISFTDTVKMLFALNQISKQEFEDLQKLNSMRNKITHQIFKEPYEKEYKGVPKREYDAVFTKTMEYAELIQQKTENIIEIKPKKSAKLKLKALFSHREHRDD